MIGIDTLKITPESLVRLAEVDEFKGLWAGLEAYTTGLQILSEVAEHGANFQRVFGPLKEQTITPQMIGLIHASQVKSKMPSFYKKEESALSIKKDGVEIGQLETAPPEDVEVLLDKLVEWLNESLDNKDFHPLLTTAIFTAVFLQISPYAEGNLRVARFLILLIMLKSGYVYAPYVPLDRVMNDKAGVVYRALKANQDSLEAGQPNWEEWLRCFFILLQDQAGSLRRRLESKDEEITDLPTLSARILELFERHKRLQMNEIIAHTNGRRATIKIRLKELLDDGYIKRHGKGRSTWYGLV